MSISPLPDKAPAFTAQLEKSPSLSVRSTQLSSKPSNLRFTTQTLFVFSTFHSLRVLSEYAPVSRSVVPVAVDPVLVHITRYCPSVSVSA